MIQFIEHYYIFAVDNNLIVLSLPTNLIFARFSFQILKHNTRIQHWTVRIHECSGKLLSTSLHKVALMWKMSFESLLGGNLASPKITCQHQTCAHKK